MKRFDEGLQVGRVVHYEHPHEKTLAAVVAKVHEGGEGRVNLSVFLQSGMLLPIRDVFPDPKAGGKSVEGSEVEGFMHHRWRWPVIEPAPVAAGIPADGATIPSGGASPSQQ